MVRKGFGIYKRKTGKASFVYWIWYKQPGSKGKRRESAKSDKLTVAKALLEQRLGEIGVGTYVGVEASRATFEDLDRVFWDEKRLKGRNLNAPFFAWKNLKKAFAGWKVEDIGDAAILHYASERTKAGAQPGTVALELAHLKHAFNVGKLAKIVGVVPNFPQIEVDNARQVFFEENEYEALSRHLSAPAAALVRFMYLTGWRISEARGLQWRNVDFEARVLRIDGNKTNRTKNKRPRTFPFDTYPPLRELLERQRNITKATETELGKIIPWVFHRDGEEIKSIRWQFESAAKKAGLPGRRTHDFRRTAVRNLERAGVPRSQAMQLTGHETEAIYRRYAIVSEKDLSEGVSKLALFHAKSQTPK